MSTLHIVGLTEQELVMIQKLAAEKIKEAKASIRLFEEGMMGVIRPHQKLLEKITDYRLSAEGDE